MPALAELERLTPDDARALALILGPAAWRPLPGPQLQGYVTQADETFYGGSAGGGKSDLLLGLALTAHRRSIIFRREYKQLGALVDRSREVIGAAGRFNGQDLVWRDLPGDRQIEFGACQLATDVTAWQGRPHDLKAFDEISNFLEAQYRFLIAWNRTTVPGQRCRVVCAGNPPTTPEGEWVVRYWAPWLDPGHPNPAKPGELRWFATVRGQDIERPDGTPFERDGETIYPRSRTFIPARLADNPFLEQTGYRATLQAMPEPLRSQMLYGDFSIKMEDDPWQVIPTAWVHAAQERWAKTAPGPLSSVGVDVARGGKDKTVLARRHGSWFAPLEKHPGANTPNGPAVAALALLALDGANVPVNVDATGVGTSVYDHLRGRTPQVNAVIFSAKAPGRDRTGKLEFVNLRAWMYWALREALDPDTGDKLALPPDRELLADLCSARWTMQTNGVQVEKKDDIAKRLGRSPDSGEAVVLAAFAQQQPSLIGGMVDRRTAPEPTPSTDAERALAAQRALLDKFAKSGGRR